MVFFAKYTISKISNGQMAAEFILKCTMETSGDQKGRPCPWKSMHEESRVFPCH